MGGRSTPTRSPHQILTMANLNPIIPAGVDWTNILQYAHTFEAIIAQIEYWGQAATGTFAGMPRPTEPRFREFMRWAYDETIQSIADIQKDPQSQEAGILLGQMWVQADGFSNLITVNGEKFKPAKGAAHILAGLPAIIAGRYRQRRQHEEGERGMRTLALMEEKFKGLHVRPTCEEIDQVREHKLEIEERAPDNPVSRKLFADPDWKSVQKGRGIIAEKVTKSKDGLLSLDPAIMEKQLKQFEREIIELGWKVQGKESCRILWSLLHDEHLAVLRHTNCYVSLLAEKFEDEDNLPDSSGMSSIATALRTHFGGGDADRRVGSYLTQEYRQMDNEPMRAFLERIKRDFSKDLNTDWDSWPRQQRRNLIRRFLAGLVEEDYKHTSTPKDVHALAEKGWPELVLLFMDIDRIIGPRGRRFTRVPQQEVRQAQHAPAAPTPDRQAWDAARPHQQPASWGQNTVSMPSAQSAGEPMSVSVNQIAARAPAAHSGVTATPYHPVEQCCRIRDNRCSNCCDHVPTGTAHPDPCDKPATCHNCLTPGHIKRDCPQAQGGGHPSQPPPGQQPAHQHPRGRGRGRGYGGRRANPQPPAQAAYPQQQALNAFGQRATYQSFSQLTQEPSVNAIQGLPPAHYGNRLSNAYWGRAPPRVRNRPRRRRTNSEGLTIDQRIDRMGRDLVEIREAMEWAMKEMTRLKDHVDYQLDLRAPFTFMFNHISQDPAAQPPAVDLEAPSFIQEEAEYAELAEDPSFIQEEAEYAELTGNDSPWGQLHCIREGEGDQALPRV